MNKPFYNVYFLFTLIFIYIISTAFDPLRNTGIAGFTGSPSEQTCISNCHNTYALNSGAGSVTISATPAFTNNQYVPGQVYTVTVHVAQTNIRLFGFGFEALNASNTNAGTLSTSGFSSVQLKTSSLGRTNVVHTTNGGSSTTMAKDFNFSWTAPTSGNVTLYAAGNACNGNNSDSFDYVYTTSLALTPQIAAGLQMENISQNPEIIFSKQNNILALKYSAQNELVQLNLVSLNGSKIILKNNVENGIQTENIDLTSFNVNGIYFVVMQIGKKTFTKKIIL